jgi:hypothetical protein
MEKKISLKLLSTQENRDGAWSDKTPSGEFYRAELVSLEEFREWVATGSVTDYDGSGYYASVEGDTVICICPVLLDDIQDDMGNHVVWYNK